MFLLFAEEQTLINFGFVNRIDPKPTLGKKLQALLRTLAGQLELTQGKGF
jgi:hypothetical protein